MISPTMTGAVTASALVLQAPQIEWSNLVAIFVLFGGAAVSVLLEALVPRRARRSVQIALTTLVLIAALVAVIVPWSRGDYLLAGESALALDGPTYATWSMLMVFGLGTVLLFAERMGGAQTSFVANASSVPGSALERESEEARREHTEVFPLLLFCLFGMMLFAASNDLILMFVALEIFSLPLYLLTGLSRRRRLVSQEASVKYFLLGALSSAIFLYGIALVYGAAGSFQLGIIAQASMTQISGSKIFAAGMILLAVGLLFKVGAVPFHNWTPDVYTGAPSPVTAFMSIATKMVAVLGLMRVMYVAMGAMRWDWQLLLAVVAVASMAVGAIVGLSQTDMKRMLAYSSIAHAGFIMVGVVGAYTLQTGQRPDQTGSVSSVLIYLAGYGLATIGFFMVILMVRKAGGESTEIDSWAGLGRRHPMLGALIVLFMLSFAGIPATAGFTGKLFVFLAGWRGGYAWLVLLGVIFSLVAAYFYLNVIYVVFFKTPGEQAQDVEVGDPSVGGWIVLVVCALGTLILGLYPQPIIEMVNHASVFLR